MRRDDDSEPLTTAGIGHNGGPALENREPPWRGGDPYVYFCWKMAHDAVWKNVPYDIMMLRLRRAEAAGVSYREYSLEILDRGRCLQPADQKVRS